MRLSGECTARPCTPTASASAWLLFLLCPATLKRCVALPFAQGLLVPACLLVACFLLVSLPILTFVLCLSVGLQVYVGQHHFPTWTALSDSLCLLSLSL